MILTNGCGVLMELVWSYIVIYCSHLNSGNGCVHGSTFGTVETVVFMVVHWEQWKRLCSWYYIGNSGNEMCSWYNIGKSGKVVFTVLYPLGTVETVMFMVLYCEQWKHMCSWNYIGNSGNEICSWYYIGNSGNGYVHGTILRTVETGVLMVLHWEPWKRLCSWNYIGNSGNDCAHGTTLGTVETIVLMELHSEQFSETMVFMVLHLRTAETIVFIVLRWERRKYP